MKRRVILLGKTGNGKSSTGNSILEDKIFTAKKCANSVTSICEVEKRELKDGRIFEVCDTPGLFCHGEDPIEMALKIQKSVEICPNPDAFLLVSSGSRMTTDEKYSVNLLRIIFGDEMFDHCIVVFTRGDEFESKLEFEEFWSKNDEMKKIVERCGNRVVKIENSKLSPEKSELGGLLEMIEQLAINGSYEGRFLKTHTEVLEKYKLKYGVSKSEEIDKHLQAVLNTLESTLKQDEKILEEEKRRVKEESKRLAKLKRETELEEKRLKEKKRRMEEVSKRWAKLKKEAQKEIENRKIEGERRIKKDRQRMYEEISEKKQEEEKRLAKEQQILSEKQRQIDEDRRLIETEKEENRETQKNIKTVAAVVTGVALTLVTGGAGIAAMGAAGAALGAAGAAVVPVAAAIKKIVFDN